MKKCVSYAERECKQRSIQLSLGSATNGLLTERQIEWAVNHKVELTISFDGPPQIQDSQRALPSGKASHEFVEATVHELVDRNISFRVRSTVTAQSVNGMKETVGYFHKLGIKNMHFEPVAECGRCLETNTLSPDPLVFVKRFIEAFELAETLNMTLYYSGCSIGRLTDKFCGAAGRNFYVTPEGFITACLEVMHKDDPAASVFFYGKIDNNTSSFKLSSEKIELLRSRTVDKMKECSKCFCKWHCAGDCLIRSWRKHGSLFKTGGYRCTINRKLTKYLLTRYISNSPIRMENFELPLEIEVT